jgi:imidazole glycerol-phosphate synthase subunit HisF
MQKIRLIPVILLRNGVVVQSKGFKRYQSLGNPSTIVWRLTNWYSDELIYLDISQEAVYDLRRDDLNYNNIHNIIDILKEMSRKCFMPLTFGGRIRNLKDIYDRLNAGADKISINSEAFRTPDFIEKSAREFGSQCITISMDTKSKDDEDWEVYIDGGRTPTGYRPKDWAVEVQNRGAGEILLNSIDRDGTGKGYDTDLIESVVNAVKIPVIAMGGVGEWEHFEHGIKAGASAVAAANIFQYTENSVYHAKKHLYEAAFNVRKPVVETIVTEGGL